MGHFFFFFFSSFFLVSVFFLLCFLTFPSYPRQYFSSSLCHAFYIFLIGTKIVCGRICTSSLVHWPGFFLVQKACAGCRYAEFEFLRVAFPVIPPRKQRFRAGTRRIAIHSEFAQRREIEGLQARPTVEWSNTLFCGQISAIFLPKAETITKWMWWPTLQDRAPHFLQCALQWPNPGSLTADILSGPRHIHVIIATTLDVASRFCGSSCVTWRDLRLVNRSVTRHNFHVALREIRTFSRYKCDVSQNWPKLVLRDVTWRSATNFICDLTWRDMTWHDTCLVKGPGKFKFWYEKCSVALISCG